MLGNINKFISDFSVGDILKIIYRVDYLVFEFKGICVSKKKKKFLNSNSSFIIRNIVSGVAVELFLNYNFTFVLQLILNKHKKKKLNYKLSKLFYLRRNKNKDSLYK